MSLHAIINSKKTKYVVLDEIFKKNVNPDAEVVNFIIDVNSIVSSLYTPSVIDVFKSLNVDEKFLLSSELLNVASHYRHYCYSRLGKYSTFYFIYSDEISSYSRKIDPGYRKTHNEKYVGHNSLVYGNVNKIVHKNHKMSKIISEYLPHCYMINTGDIEPHVASYYIAKEEASRQEELSGSRFMNVILSNDKCFYQSALAQEDSIIMTIKYDKSEIIEREAIMDDLLKGIRTPIENKLIPEFFPFVLAFAGYKKYDVDGLKLYGSAKTVKFLNSLLDGGDISNVKYNNIDLFADSLSDHLNEDQIETVKRNIRLLDSSIGCSKLTLTEKAKINEQIFDRVDGESLRYMNDYYYKKYPINLEYLVEGEDYF
jgi:hypothetical protein